MENLVSDRTLAANAPLMQEQIQGKTALFLPRLESLRGCAALIVAAYHSILFIPEGSKTRVARAAMNIVYGPGSVFIFFILSGFVLGISISKFTTIGPKQFMRFWEKRIRRLFPALFVSLIIITILQNRFHIISSESAHISLVSFIRNVFLLDVDINGVTWSLQVEMIWSIIFPLLHTLVRRSAKLQILAFIPLLLPYIAWRQQWTAPQPASQAPLIYLFMFHFGYLASIYGKRIFHLIEQFRGGPALVLTVATAVCCSTPHFGNHFLPFTIAATLIVLLIASGSSLFPFRVLDQGWAKFYGRISYSFYLLHPLFLFLVLDSLEGMLVNKVLQKSAIALLISTVLTTPFAWLSHKYVEMKFQAKSPKLGSDR